MTKKIKAFFSFAAIAVIAVMTAAFPVHAGDKNQAYWVDAVSNLPLEQLALLPEEGRTIRLAVTVPEGKALKLYQFEVLSDKEKVSVEDVATAPASDFPPMNINTHIPGKVIANSFDLNGVKGGSTVYLMDITVVGKAVGTSDISAVFSNFGNEADKFLPDTPPLKVIVK